VKSGPAATAGWSVNRSDRSDNSTRLSKLLLTTITNPIHYLEIVKLFIVFYHKILKQSRPAVYGMGLFDNMLHSDQSLFKNEVALSYEFIPKTIPFRENEQHHIASCIKPLFDGRTGRNIFVFGPSGLGKTVACKHILAELEEQTDDILALYINCWKHNTSFKVINALCDALAYRFVQNKKTNELFSAVRQIINRKSAVFVLDEVDKAEDLDFLYSILEEIYKKAIILITNTRAWLSTLDSRISSRLMPEVLEFREYSKAETNGILSERIGYAFVPGIWDKDAIQRIVDETFMRKDVRLGIYLLKEAGSIAEERSSRRIELRDAEAAIGISERTAIKGSDRLDEEDRQILHTIESNPDSKIGDVYRSYQEAGGKKGYKTFQRRVARLAKDNMVKLERIAGGKEGNTTIVKAVRKGRGEKSLTEF